MLIVLTEVIAAPAQAQFTLWRTEISAAYHAVGGRGVASYNGAVYVPGENRRASPPNSLATNEWVSSFLNKYSAIDGQLVWSRMPAAAPSAANAVAAGHGCIYVVGWAAIAAIGSPKIGAFVSGYDESGNLLWSRTFSTVGSGGEAIALSVAVDPSGVYISGWVQGQLGEGTGLSPFIGDKDAFVRKYNHYGTHLWSHQFGSPEADIATDVALHAGSLYVSGKTDGSLPLFNSAGGTDAFIRKYDIFGNQFWTRQFGGPNIDVANSVAADSSGVYVAGHLSGYFRVQFGDTFFFYYFFIRKYDSNGNLLWTNHKPGLRPEVPDRHTWATAVTVGAGAVYVAGAGAYGLILSSYESHNLLGDGFVRKYDVNGSEIWTIPFQSPYDDAVNGVAADGNSIYVAGTISGLMDGYVAKLAGFLQFYNRDMRSAARRGRAAAPEPEPAARERTRIRPRSSTGRRFKGQAAARSASKMHGRREGTPFGSTLWDRSGPSLRAPSVG
jgi:hypothetical protein